MKSANSVRTALLLIDVQNGLRHPTYYGTGRSTPNLEDNVTKLLDAARAWNENVKQNQTDSRPLESVNGADTEMGQKEVPIIHIHHLSTNPNSPLYPGAELLLPDISDGKDTAAAPKEIKKIKGTDPMPCAAPLPGEPIMTKNVNSAFIGTGLEALLRKEKVRQLVVVGITTDHCVSTTVRMGANLGVLHSEKDQNGDAEEGQIVLVSDGCATYGKAGFDGDTVHQVNLASLDGEFAELGTTRAVLREVFGA